MAYLLSLAHEP